MRHSSSVKICKRYIVRTGDMFHMNGKFSKRLPTKTWLSCKTSVGAGRLKKETLQKSVSIPAVARYTALIERYTTRPYRLVVIKMISNDIQELLKNITKSLIKIETKELDALISRQSIHIDNIDFHRYEISHRKIESLKFSFCSFRGAFISYSSFTNCNFINCSFITAIVCNTKFTNCTFINCVFRSMHMQDNLISNCSFQNCHIEDNIFSTNKT